MRKIHLVLFFCIGVIPYVLAQTNTIEGRIFNKENSPIQEAIVVLQTIDSIYSGVIKELLKL